MKPFILVTYVRSCRDWHGENAFFLNFFNFTLSTAW